MTCRTLIRRSLRYHWRAHLGVTFGAAIGSAALIGALVVGDSVRGSLWERALERLGWIQWAMPTQDRFVRTKLAEDLNEAFVGGVHPILRLNGVGSAAQLRINRLNVYGVESGFWRLSSSAERLTPPFEAGVVLNSQAADRLNLKVGDEVLLRVDKPTMLSREAALVSKSDGSASLRLPLSAIVSDAEMGAFSLETEPGPPASAFVSLTRLQDAVGLSNVANLLLIGRAENTTTSLQPNAELENRWSLTDAGIEMRLGSSGLEMTSRRIFLDAPMVQGALACQTNAQPLLTYLATLLQAGTNVTPYSMITAAGSPWTPADMRADEIVVSQWLADDLHAKPGDEIALSYFDPESGARLIERTNTFRVRSIVPMEMPWADRTLMPDFPGIEKAESTHDWDAGFPLTYKIRQQDEDYWKQFRGTPKAFVTLAAGQKMWGNRFGNLTAIRFPIPTNATLALTPALSPRERENRSPVSARILTGESPAASEITSAAHRLLPLPGGEGRGEGERQTNFVESYRAALEKEILATLKPEELGLRFEPVREQALRAAEQSQDFGGLFLGFSFFLIAAALLLVAMLFQLGLEQRAPEIGTLLALGFTARQVRKLLLGEAIALSLLGGVLGALGGLVYAKAMLHGLATVWRDAVGATSLSFHVTGPTLAVGLFASVAVSVVTIWMTLRKFVRRPAAELLAGEVAESGRRACESAEGGRRTFRVLTGAATMAWLALVAALVLAGWMLAKGDTANAGAFFGAGALMLIAELGFVSAWLARHNSVLRTSCLQNHLVPGTPDSQMKYDLPAGRRQHVTLGSLGLRGCARRRKRSLATVAMLACGSFLIVSIGVFRLDGNRDATKRSSGTGGFALIGESTMPVVQDLNSPSGRDFFALKEVDLKGVSFVPFRVREGDEASCLNLNRAQKPRLLGVKPELLEGRFRFAKGEVWRALSRSKRFDQSDGSDRPDVLPEVAAIGDANSIQWAMGKKVGDAVDYVDERGQPFKVRIVGAVANSILQGQLLIDEVEFVKRFPGESGYRQFLIDAPTNRVAEVSATLSRAMQDVGLELTSAPQRLAQFNAVQNTYLGTFQVLGGLGLLLGSVGLAIVVLRNVLERRGELAVLLAVGFRKPTLQRLLLIENGALLGLGLAVGIIAAAVAVLPALLSPGTQLPWLTLALTLAAVLLNGALWTWAATRVALRGDLLAALRNE